VVEPHAYGNCLSVRFGGAESAVLPDSAAPNLTVRLTEAFICTYEAPISISNAHSS